MSLTNTLPSALEPSFKGVKGAFYAVPADVSGFFFLRNSTDNQDAKIYAELRNGHRVIVAVLQYTSTAEKVMKDLTDNYAHIRASIEAEKLAREEQRQELNHYERRIDSKRDRYEELAVKKRREAHTAFDTSHNIVAQIPFGQPILVGHHSEKRHRAMIERSDRQMGKACQLDKTADYYESRAAKVGTGGISSDDPEAIYKLEAKLAGLKSAHEKMIAANKIIRKKTLTNEQKIDQLFCLGLSEKQSIEILKPKYGEIGFASYSLKNSNAVIKSTEDRIKQLNKFRSLDDKVTAHKGFKVEIDTEDNRILIRFDSKPDEVVCAMMRRRAFKFSPSRKNAWVRQITNNALYSTRILTEELNKLFK